MAEMRTFRFGIATSVVALHGELDDDTAAATRREIARRLRDGAVVVDLLNVRVAARGAVDSLLPQLRHPRVTTVAERRLFAGRELELAPTLAAALLGD